MGTSGDEYFASGEGLLIYPNPASGRVIYFSRSVSGTIYELKGTVVMQVSLSQWSDVQLLAPGIYLFRPENGDPQRFIVAGSR